MEVYATVTGPRFERFSNLTTHQELACDLRLWSLGVRNTPNSMHITIEEEIVLLYALYMCGRKPSKCRATQFIITNALLKDRKGDQHTVSTGESRAENRIAYTRLNLKLKGELSMPDRGNWAMTQKGVERIEKIAIRSLKWEEPNHDLTAALHEVHWERFSDVFLERLKLLGGLLKQ